MGRGNAQVSFNNGYKSCLGKREEKNIPWRSDGIAGLGRENVRFHWGLRSGQELLKHSVQDPEPRG